VKEEITKTAAWASLEGIAAGAQAVDDVIRAALRLMFAQARSLATAWDYVSALSEQVKADGWALAEAAGHEGWHRMQALLNSYVWDPMAVRGLLARLVGLWLRCPDDDLLGPGLAIDETAALKKGEWTFGVGPQQAGCTGKVENCVTSVFTAYVTPTEATWVDFDVYMPQRWADDEARRARAGVPQDLEFTTKPDLAAAQLRRLAAAGLRFGWAAGEQDRLRGEVFPVVGTLFRVALLRTTRTRFRVRGSSVTYAAFVAGEAWMAS
jgi:SRSO17 transposase